MELKGIGIERNQPLDNKKPYLILNIIFGRDENLERDGRFLSCFG